MQTDITQDPAIKVRRIGLLMEPDSGNADEAMGVFNPGAARGPDGHLYIFPRLVATGNYSRIAIARVLFDQTGDPTGVQRLGVILQPEAEFELNHNGGGCEDARVSWVDPLQRYVMTYTALTTRGPRIALAISKDLFQWERLGLAWFETQMGPDLNDVVNKDGVLFPIALNDPRGVPSIAMIHRPLFPGTEPQSVLQLPLPRIVDVTRESMWISYCPLEAVECNRNLLCHFMSHHRLASPLSPWERLKIGAGAPPIASMQGFILIYHGVCASEGDQGLEYAAGFMILDARDGKTILYRSVEPILKPMTPQELDGTTPRVVFPCGIDRRTDIGQPNRFDIYYGMADFRIGVASLELPDTLPLSALRDPHNFVV
jgi:beta-1,2-mannobiose phosphorylase / 1,2-beta-oligomannan phosphorylase